MIAFHFWLSKGPWWLDNQDNQEWDMKPRLQYLAISWVTWNFADKPNTKRIYCEFMWIYGLMASTHVASGDSRYQHSEIPSPNPFISGWWWMSEQTNLYNIANVYIVLKHVSCWGRWFSLMNAELWLFPTSQRSWKLEKWWLNHVESWCPKAHHLPVFHAKRPNTNFQRSDQRFQTSHILMSWLWGSKAQSWHPLSDKVVTG